MACINMYNNEQQSFCTGPRISFSNDFADTKQSTNHEYSYREAPVSSDFEFSVPGNSLNISADEVFSKGKLVPALKENSTTTTKVVTLRDELLAGEDDCQDIFHYRLPKNSGWWKEKFGLKKNQNGSKKSDQIKNFGGLETIDEARKPVFANELYTYMTGTN